MSSKVFRLLRAISISTFSFSFIVGTSPHLFLHNPWLTESSGADQSIINPWGSAFYIIYIHINLAPALFNVKMSTDSILIGWSEKEKSCLTWDIINSKLLPHELKQEHKTSLIILKVLKVAHEQFTWSGGEIPHIDRYGGHIWQTLLVGSWMHE